MHMLLVLVSIGKQENTQHQPSDVWRLWENWGYDEKLEREEETKNQEKKPERSEENEQHQPTISDQSNEQCTSSVETWSLLETHTTCIFQRWHLRFLSALRLPPCCHCYQRGEELVSWSYQSADQIMAAAATAAAVVTLFWACVGILGPIIVYCGNKRRLFKADPNTG